MLNYPENTITMAAIKQIPNSLIFFLFLFFISCKTKLKLKAEVDSPYDNIIAANKYEFDLLKNPETGKIPDGVIEAAYFQGKNLPDKEQLASTGNSRVTVNTYTPVGPDNLGGRTRAFAYDVRFNGSTNNVMIAGSVSSGVMRSADGGLSWTKVSGTLNIHDITCIAQDPRVGFQDTWYLGTGESLGNSSSASSALRLGYGVYKSTDNGLTWDRQPASNTGVYESFDSRSDVVSKIVVDPTTGYVYMAILQGIFRSTDGGNTWTDVLSVTVGGLSTSDVTDVVCTNNGILYAAINGRTGANSIGPFGDGVWTSSTGMAGSWTRIGYGGNPVGWKTTGGYGRIVLALAPSNQNILYAFYELNTGGADLFQYNASILTWSARRFFNLPAEGSLNGNFDTQQGYDIAIAVKPDDPNFVIIGGTNAYVSPDGFSTLNNYRRIGGYASINNFNLYANHHPDIHSFAFEPGSNLKMVSVDDGGLQVTTDVTAAAVAWSSLNNNYQTYQYYYTAIDPTIGSTKYIGGAQDNGTTYRNAGNNTMQPVFSGDGFSVGISSGNNFHYCSTQFGHVYRRASTDPINTATDISPNTGGSFRTLFHLDPDNTENLYYAIANTLYRNTGASIAARTFGSSPGQWQNMTGVSNSISGSITSFATTRGPYDPSHALYIGTDAAVIYRLDDPQNASPTTVPVMIKPLGITANSTVIGIAVAPQNDDTVLAVISNYGVPSVFWTGNATAAIPTWYNVEGTGPGKLDLPSFRSCAIVARQTGFEYYVGTSVGLFSTASIISGSQANANLTSWVKEGSGIIDQAVVTSLSVRNNDNTMLVGTHGNGMFVASISSPLPVTLSSFNAVKYINDVKLNWLVFSENNVKEYIVERKYLNENFFVPIGSVPAMPFTAGLRTYELTDNTVAFNRGTIQYRLKISDLDSKSSFSKIVSVKGNVSDMVTRVYPTLAKNIINIIFPFNPAIKNVNISIADNSGRILFKNNYTYKNTGIPITNLPKGIYYLVISTEQQKYTAKFEKQ